MIVKSAYNQSLIDLAIQEYGSAWITGLLAILEAADDDLSLAMQLQPGTEIECPAIPEQQSDLALRYLKARGVKVATGQYLSPGPYLTIQYVTDTSIIISWTNPFQEKILVYINDELVTVVPSDTLEFTFSGLNADMLYKIGLAYEHINRLVEIEEFTGGISIWQLSDSSIPVISNFQLQ